MKETTKHVKFTHCHRKRCGFKDVENLYSIRVTYNFVMSQPDKEQNDLTGKLYKCNVYFEWLLEVSFIDFSICRQGLECLNRVKNTCDWVPVRENVSVHPHDFPGRSKILQRRMDPKFFWPRSGVDRRKESTGKYISDKKSK